MFKPPNIPFRTKSKEIGLNNAAAFERCLLYAARKNAGIRLEGSVFILAAIVPASGEWYFIAPCNHCGNETPIFKDPSRGHLGNPFVDSGTFRSACGWCGRQTRSVAEKVKSLKWDASLPKMASVNILAEKIREAATVVQIAPEPIIKGCGIVRLCCVECGHLLIDGYSPRNVVGVRIECYSCGAITETDPWPDDEPPPINLMPLGAGSEYGLKHLVLNDQTLMGQKELDRTRTKSNAYPNSQTSINLSTESLNEFVSKISAIVSKDFEELIKTSSRLVDRGSKASRRCAPAWAIGQLRRSVSDGAIDLDGDDLIAVSYIQLLDHLTRRWSHHPVFQAVAKEFLDNFYHTATMFTFASYCADNDIPIGFTKPGKDKSPDLFINSGAQRRISIEVKTKKALRWPAATPTSGTLQKLIKECCISARDQLVGSAGGLVVIGTWLNASPEFFAAIKLAVEAAISGRISRRIAAIGVVCFGEPSYSVGEPAGSGIAIHSEAKIELILNPQFEGVQPFAVAAAPPTNIERH